MQATIIVPCGTGDEQAYQHGLQWNLAHRFGGYTARESVGGWTNGKGQLIREPVMVYDVACEDTAEVREQFHGIAADVARDLHQECVFLAFDPDRKAEFILPRHL